MKLRVFIKLEIVGTVDLPLFSSTMYVDVRARLQLHQQVGDNWDTEDWFFSIQPMNSESSRLSFLALVLYSKRPISLTDGSSELRSALNKTWTFTFRLKTYTATPSLMPLSIDKFKYNKPEDTYQFEIPFDELSNVTWYPGTMVDQKSQAVGIHVKSLFLCKSVMFQQSEFTIDRTSKRLAIPKYRISVPEMYFFESTSEHPVVKVCIEDTPFQLLLTNMTNNATKTQGLSLFFDVVIATHVYHLRKLLM